MRNRKRPVVLVAVLLLLYITPMIFGPSYTSPTILKESNPTKEFSSAEYLDESQYSINGFYETLEDNSFYTPDGFYDSTPVLGFGGGGTATNNDWNDSLVLDGSRWSTFESNGEYIFFVAEHAIEGFEYSIYGYAGGAGSARGNLTIKDYSLDPYGETYFPIMDTDNQTEQWYNGTIFAGVMSTYDPPTIYFLAQAFDGGVIGIDYIEIRFFYLPSVRYSRNAGLGIEEHYGTSFTNISPWSVISGSALSTDSDVMTISHIGDSGWDTYECDMPDVQGISYVEIRIKWGSDAGANNFLLSVDEEDDWSGATSEPLGYLSTIPSTWSTYKAIIEQDVGSVRLGVQSTAADTLLIDYLRIGASDEMGFQHDGSTTEALQNEGSANWTFGASSDGDILSLTWDRESTAVDTGAWQQINIDDTSTSAEMELTYYPFWELRYRVTESTNASIGNLQVYTADTRLALTSITSVDETTEWSIMRYNMLASADTGIAGNSIRFYCGNSEDTATLTLEIDFTGFYSIANYSYLQGAVSTDDVFYVDSTILYCENDAGDYMGLLADPSLNITDTYNEWNISTETGLGNEFSFRLYNGGWTSFNDEETNGTMPAGTITDLAFYTYNDVMISEILFIDAHRWNLINSVDIIFHLPQWHLINSIIVIFWLDISTMGINFFLIFLGLAMIPLSTVYLVKGGRSEMSMDKVFFGAVIFILGWAFFLGGIFV